jgi:recombination protein RecA
VENNIVEKSGAWFSYGGERIGQGRENARDYLKLHPETLNDIEIKVFEKFGVVRPNTPAGIPVDLAKAVAGGAKGGSGADEEKRPRVKAVK